MTINRERLAPCPFCGSRDVEVQGKPAILDALDSVFCNECTADAPYPVWNTRAQAQAAPEDEPVACWLKSNHPGADIVVLGKPEDIHAAAADTKIPLYAAPQHDAELVELIGQLVSLAAITDEDTARSIAERIDAKLATLSAKNEGGKA